MGLKPKVATANDDVVEKAEVTEESHSEVAVAEPETALPATQNQDFTSRMAQQGFGGLEIGFGSFPIIKLMNDGLFADSDENEIGKEFSCKLLNTRPSYLYKQKNNNDSDVYYSYDTINLTTTSDGGSSTVNELREEWKEDGWEMERKDYLECVCIMDDADSEYADEMFILSIPPNSRRKLAGVIAGLEFKGIKPKDVSILCSVGKKRKSGSNTYYPWNFKAA